MHHPLPRHHQRTLEALYAHPLQHGIRVSRVEALLRTLGAEVSESGDRRLQVQLPDGAQTWLAKGRGPVSPDLDAEAVLRLRRLLEAAGITPQTPEAGAASERGDVARRLVLHLSHHSTDAFRLEGDAVEHAELRPLGIWGSGENLTHRHDRDVAGQRAPRDNDYLARITAAIAEADAVLMLGHGSGESDMRLVLLHYLETHRRDLLERIVGIETLDDAGMSHAELLAVAREHFGNLPHRRPLVIPGQEVRQG